MGIWERKQLLTSKFLSSKYSNCAQMFEFPANYQHKTQCAIMEFFKARLWWCFVILWRLFKSYWTFFLTKSFLKYLIIIYLLSKYYYLIPGTLRKPFKNRSDSYEPPCRLIMSVLLGFYNNKLKIPKPNFAQVPMFFRK